MRVTGGTDPGDTETTTIRHSSGSITLQNVQVGGNFNIYLDGLPEAAPRVRNPFEEGRRLQEEGKHLDAIREFEKAFATAEDDRQRAALHIIIGVSISLSDRSKLGEAEGHLRQALAIAEELGGKEAQASSLCTLGVVYILRGDLDRAEEYHQRALAIHEEIDDRRGQARQLGNLGIVYRQRGDLPRAEEHYLKALTIQQEIGDNLGQAIKFGDLGFLAEQRGDIPKARELLTQAQELFREIGANDEGPEIVRRALERLGGPEKP